MQQWSLQRYTDWLKYFSAAKIFSRNVRGWLVRDISCWPAMARGALPWMANTAADSSVAILPVGLPTLPAMDTWRIIFVCIDLSVCEGGESVLRVSYLVFIEFSMETFWGWANVSLARQRLALEKIDKLRLNIVERGVKKRQALAKRTTG